MALAAVLTLLAVVILAAEAVRSSRVREDTDAQWFVDHTDTAAKTSPTGIGGTAPPEPSEYFDQLLGPRVLEVEPRTAQRVAALMAHGHQVAAVMLVAEELHCGILDAEATARAVAAQATRE